MSREDLGCVRYIVLFADRVPGVPAGAPVVGTMPRPSIHFHDDRPEALVREDQVRY